MNTNGNHNVARELDLTGLKCPMPTLLAEKALRGLVAGSVLAVTVTDPMAPLDLRYLCQRDGHELLSEEAPNEFGARRLLICRGPRP